MSKKTVAPAVQLGEIQSVNSRRKEDSQSLAAEVLESTSDGVFMLDHEWRFIYLNTQARLLISEGRNLIGRNVWEEFPAATDLPFGHAYRTVMRDRVAVEFVSFYPSPLDRWFDVHAYPTHRGMSVYFRDVTARHAEEERLRLLEQAVLAAPVGITIARVDKTSNCPLTYVNPAFEALTGYVADEVLGLDCRFLQGPDFDQEERSAFRSSIEEAHPATIQIRNYRKDGTQFFNEVLLSPVHDGKGEVSHIVAIQRDVSDRIAYKQKLALQAQTDAVTGLANRYLLLERLQAGLLHAAAEGGRLAVVIVDLDNFKHLNDRFGHMEADRVLVQVGRRLNAVLDPTDTVARLGGDEFALVLRTWPDLGRLQKLLELILAEIKRPISLGKQEVLVTGSAGVALFPQDAQESEQLLQMADLSMYWGKRCGKNSFRFYTPELRTDDNMTLDVAIGFRKALQNREFRLVYQPRVDAHTQEVKGFEALIRWQHPERGLLLPAQFVPVAEDTGLIHEIGKWVLEEALQQNACWRSAGFEPVSMSVNVSAAQIRDPDFPAMVACALKQSGIPAESLELELTESLLIDNAELASVSLQALKRLGVRIAIDDFGAGCSSLRYLARFPINTIKVDHFFTANIATDEVAATICHAVVTLGHTLGLMTVAEGVESEAQASLLRTWMCSELQGYMFAKPLASHAAEQLLSRSLVSQVQ